MTLAAEGRRGRRTLSHASTAICSLRRADVQDVQDIEDIYICRTQDMYVSGPIGRSYDSRSIALLLHHCIRAVENKTLDEQEIE